MGQFEQVRASLRRAYEVGIGSLRLGRARDAAADDDARAGTAATQATAGPPDPADAPDVLAHGRPERMDPTGGREGRNALRQGRDSTSLGRNGMSRATGAGGREKANGFAEHDATGSSGQAVAAGSFAGTAGSTERDEAVTARLMSAPRPLVVASSSVSHRDDLDVPRGLRVAGAWAWRVLLLVAAGVAVLWVVARLQLVVVPVIIAVLLSALLSPVVAWLRRFRLPKSLATAIVMVGGLATVGGTLYLVISQFVEGGPQLSKKAGEGLAKVQDWTKHGPLHLSQSQLDSLGNEIKNWATNNRGTLTSGALTTASTLGEILAGLALVLFTTFFFLRDGRRISRFLVGLLPERARSPVADAADLSWSTLVSYVRATVLVAMIDAIGIGIALLVLGVPFPFPLAALVFLCAFIPIVGATLSGAVAVLIAFVVNGPIVALILLAAVIGVQQLEGHVLQPLIMGRAVAIHPLAVIIAIATGAVLAGIVGALVAVPTVAVLNTGIRHLAARRRSEETGAPMAVVEPTGPPAPGQADASFTPPGT